MAMTRKEKRMRRRKHVRRNITGTGAIPRLSVFKSNRYLFVQAIDDEMNKVVTAMSEKTLKEKKDETPVDRAGRLGEEFGKALKKKKVDAVVFDRGGYKYHGRVASFADGVRKSGIKF
jgi:large subunit ribosomal protein L18